jgi:hypothetical protein
VRWDSLANANVPLKLRQPQVGKLYCKSGLHYIRSIAVKPLLRTVLKIIFLQQKKESELLVFKIKYSVVR